MNIAEAKQQVLTLAGKDIQEAGIADPINPKSPDPKDPGKFLIQNKPARAIHRYNGWFIPICLSWFKGSFEKSKIHNYEFYWYAFAIPPYAGFSNPHYYICDYLQIRDWVLDFSAPLGYDHQDHANWRADFQVYKEEQDEKIAYFRWGDESVHTQTRTNRIIALDNISNLISPISHDSADIYQGESYAHLRLKEYIASHPEIIGLSKTFSSEMEYIYCTGDKVDILFTGPNGKFAVVEIELEGEDNLIVGAHQLIKYRALLSAERRYNIASPKIHAMLVAFNTDYSNLYSFTDKYDISVYPINSDDVI